MLLNKQNKKNRGYYYIPECYSKPEILFCNNLIRIVTGFYYQWLCIHPQTGKIVVAIVKGSFWCHLNHYRPPKSLWTMTQ